ncbi:hypothetical protein OQA88_6055 [Cercophora sp. LCS_1]
MNTQHYVLVTGATGFIGAHVVDALLKHSIRVRGATRSLEKGNKMLAARPQHAPYLDFVQIDDFSQPDVFTEAVKGGITGVIHVASPFSYTIESNLNDLILPAISGTTSILKACASESSIRRLVLTSSFASVLTSSHPEIYTASIWNPLSYEEGIDPATSPIIAYRASKKFAELAAWDFIRDQKPHFDLVTLCPPMTFGPVAHPISTPEELNVSNKGLWDIACGGDLPEARVPFWIDVRDLAEMHVQAFLRREAGGKRYIPVCKERFSYEKAAEVVNDWFPWARGKVKRAGKSGEGMEYGIDWETAERGLGVTCRGFEETVVDLVQQVQGWVDRKGV